MRTLLIIGMIGLTINSFSQIIGSDKYPFDYFKPKALQSAIFETSEKIFIYNKNEVKLYFKQADIRAYIAEAGKRNEDNLKNGKPILDLLDKNLGEIEIEDSKLGFSNKTIDSLKQKGVNFGATKISFSFSLIAADLMYEGKFMVFDKKENKFIKRGLKTVFTDFYGSTMYTFLLPNGNTFYSIALRTN